MRERGSRSKSTVGHGYLHLLVYLDIIAPIISQLSQLRQNEQSFFPQSVLGVLLQQQIVKKEKSKESDSENTIVAGKGRKQCFLQKFTWLGGGGSS